MTGLHAYIFGGIIIFLLGIIPQIYLRLKRHMRNRQCRNQKSGESLRKVRPRLSENKAGARSSEVLGKGIPVSSSERLHQEALQDLRRDVGTEEAPSSLCRAEDPQHSLTIGF